MDGDIQIIQKLGLQSSWKWFILEATQWVDLIARYGQGSTLGVGGRQNFFFASRGQHQEVFSVVMAKVSSPHIDGTKEPCMKNHFTSNLLKKIK